MSSVDKVVLCIPFNKGELESISYNDRGIINFLLKQDYKIETDTKYNTYSDIPLDLLDNHPVLRERIKFLESIDIVEHEQLLKFITDYPECTYLNPARRALMIFSWCKIATDNLIIKDYVNELSSSNAVDYKKYASDKSIHQDRINFLTSINISPEEITLICEVFIVSAAFLAVGNTVNAKNLSKYVVTVLPRAKDKIKYNFLNNLRLYIEDYV
jgi:hypothetical protein